MAFTETAGARLMTRKAMGAEMLDAETELALARAWRNHGDERALHRLVRAYMRLAVAMAAKYRRYGAEMPDLIQEAGVGLMRAAEKFDPERGVRFSTYAVWWIKASIQDHVMRNWSLVRTGSTSSQKALFFNLRRVRAKIEREAGAEGVALDGQRLRAMVAEELGVPVRDVEMMEARLSGSDFSLNAQQAGEDGREWLEALEDEAPRPEEIVTRRADVVRARAWLADALGALNARERMIVVERKLRDEPRTLESLGRELGLSKERIRQLEAQALSKLRKRLESVTGSAAEALAEG
jgi:RNA polymerase sigma-32 factor